MKKKHFLYYLLSSAAWGFLLLLMGAFSAYSIQSVTPTIMDIVNGGIKSFGRLFVLFVSAYALILCIGITICCCICFIRNIVLFFYTYFFYSDKYDKILVKVNSDGYVISSEFVFKNGEKIPIDISKCPTEVVNADGNKSEDENPANS